MKDIIELTKFFTKREISDIKPWKEGSNSEKLFKGIMSGEINSLDTGLDHFNFSSKKKNSFTRLKNRYEKKLQNALFLINTEKESISEQGIDYYNAIKLFLISKIFLFRNSPKLSAKYAEKSLKLGLVCGITEVNLMSASSLSYHYSYLDANIKKSKKFAKIYRKQSKILGIEIKLLNYLSSLQHLFLVKNDREAAKIKSAEIIPKVKKYIHKYSAYSLQLYAYRILTFDAYLKDDKYLSNEYCDEAISFFKGRYKTITPLWVFNRAKIQNYISLKEFDNALMQVEETKQFMEENSFNQLLFYTNMFTINAHLKDYNELYRLAYTALSKPIIERFSQQKQAWLIKEAYVQFLAELGYVDQDIIDNTEAKKFRINKFLNEVPMYSADKTGQNVSILIIQLLWLIKDKKLDQVIEKLESLNQYTYRYLKNDDTYRYNCFIKMLLRIPKGNFHPFLTTKYTEDLYKKLKAKESKLAEFSLEVELIPYEDLWEMTMTMLGNQKK
jgi:hypothetical protein